MLFQGHRLLNNHSKVPGLNNEVLFLVGTPVRVRGQIILGGALNNKKSVLSAESGFLHGKKSSFVKAFPLSKAKEFLVVFGLSEGGGN